MKFLTSLFIIILSFKVGAGVFSPVDEEEEEEASVEIQTQGSLQPDSPVTHDLSDVPELEFNQESFFGPGFKADYSFEDFKKYNMPKGGSAVFEVLSYQIMIGVNEFIKAVFTVGENHPHYGTAGLFVDLGLTCKQDACKNGIDFSKLKPETVKRVIPSFLTLNLKIHTKFFQFEGKGVAVLQGADLQKDDFYSQMIHLFSKVIGPQGKIYINMPIAWNSAGFLSGLSEHMIKNEVELHIFGICSDICANFLVPAAKKVILEPTGSIFYNSSFTAQSIYLTKGTVTKRDAIQQLLDTGYEKDGLGFLADFIIGLGPKQYAYYLKNLDPLQSIREKLVSYIDEKRGDYAEEDIDKVLESKENHLDFLGRLSMEDVKEAKRFHYNYTFNKYLIDTRMLQALQAMSAIEITTIKNIELDSKLPYSFMDFVHFSQRLSRMEGFLHNFGNTRAIMRDFYQVPESENKIQVIVPSSELLRSLGVNVEGQNDLEFVRDIVDYRMDKSTRGDKDHVFYVDEKIIEKCGFFQEGASYTRESLKECAGY